MNGMAKYVHVMKNLVLCDVSAIYTYLLYGTTALEEL